MPTQTGYVHNLTYVRLLRVILAWLVAFAVTQSEPEKPSGIALSIGGTGGLITSAHTGWSISDVVRTTNWPVRSRATRKRVDYNEIAGKLAIAEGLLAKGKVVAEVCHELQISESTYYRWRNQFRSMGGAAGAERLQILAMQVGDLKRQLAAAELENRALRELVQGKF